MAWTGLELKILQPPYLECWDGMDVSPQPAVSLYMRIPPKVWPKVSISF